MYKKNKPQKLKKASQIPIKKWLELTLCDLVDEVMYAANSKRSPEEIMYIIYKYTNEIFITQGQYDKNKRI